MADTLRVNGNEVSWGSLKLRIDEDPYFGFTAIEFGDGRERAYGWGLGAGHAPRSKSRGKYTPKPVKLTGFVRSVQAAKAALAALSDSGTEYGNVEFDVVLQYQEAGGETVTVELLGCTWAENDGSHEESPDPLKRTFSLMPMRVRENGLKLYDED